MKEKNLREHERNIYVSCIASVSMSFRDAPKYSIEEIINTFKGAERIQNLGLEVQQRIRRGFMRNIKENIIRIIHEVGNSVPKKEI